MPEQSNERKQIEEQLKFQAEVLAQISDAVVAIDTQRNVSYWNKAAEQLYGFSYEQAIGRNLDDLYTTVWLNPQDQQASVETIFQSGVWKSEVKQRKADGVEIYVQAAVSLLKDSAGQNNGLLAIIRDISERKQAQTEREELQVREQNALQQLDVSEERFRVATEAAKIGLWFWNLVTGHLEWTDKCKALFGLPQETVISYEKFLEVLHPDDREPTNDAVQRSLTQKAEFDTEYRAVWPDGNIHWIAAKGRAFYAPDGRVLRLVGIVLDIDARKQVENARQELDRQKDDFLIIAGHELRTPLTSIKGYTQLLQRKVGRHPDLVTELQLLNNINHQSNRMNGLINEMLDISRIESGQLRLNYSYNRDLVALVRIVVEQRQVSTSHHKLTLDTSSDVIEGTFDEGRIEQVLNNLIGNAIKYSPPDQPINICVRPDPTTNEVTISIQDYGIGISRDQQAHLFDRFNRVRDSVTNKIDGLGLGLYISHEIIRRHGGRIWLESAPNVGSTFYFTLPLRVI